MKLRAILIDDEIDSIKALENDIKAFDLDIDILAKCQSGKEGIKAIRKHNPDVIFLDVKMPYMNGFEMLELIEDINFEIVFVSGYDEYAKEAFKLSATHFISKPVDEDDLNEAIDRVIKNRKENDGWNKKQVEELIHNIKSTDNNKRFAIPTMTGYVFYPLSNIIYCQADGGCTKVIATDKNYISGHTLGEFEDRLPENIFCRIHNSHIINMEHIKEYNKGKTSFVTMSNGDSLNISEGKKANFISRFKW